MKRRFLGATGLMNLRVFSIRLQLHGSVYIIAILLVGSIELTYGQGFHSGGVGSCNGCHSMHSAQIGSQQLLLRSDPSSICLNCHAGRGGANSPSVFSPDGSALTPGGDFYWLTKSFSWLDGQSPGFDHGHNIVARDFNLLSDPILTTSPGGNYPAAKLGCDSCHDPHGQVAGGTSGSSLPVSRSGSYGAGSDADAISGNYRLLGDADYVTAGYSFSNAAPIARQSNVNKYEETDISHVDYGSGMSEWCGNCHAALLNSNHHAGGIPFQHASGSSAFFSQESLNIYNSYVKTGDLSGLPATAYLQFVPFERGTSSMQFLDPNSTQGPDANSNVMCLTCHRAHASAFPNGGRWDFTASLLVDSHPASGDAGAASSDSYYSYYGRNVSTDFGAGQGPFCEKCHVPALP